MLNISKIIYSLKNKPYKIAQTLECGFLTSGKHKIYYETSGNPNGVPVIISHGGSGGSISYNKRAFYNPKKYYIIQIDQRGCGKSTPSLATEDNNTSALIADMETLREKLNIDKWVVAGGSWGSTLSIAYALSHKSRVLGLLINGIFLAGKDEFEASFSAKGPAARLFPDQYKKFIAPLTKTEAKKPLQAYIKKITKTTDPTEKEALLKSFIRWEWLLCTMQPNFDFIDKKLAEDESAISLASLELHYFENNCFIDYDELIVSLDYLSDIPTFIIQGRFDLVCNPATAQLVADKIENSTLAYTFDGHTILSKAGKAKFVEYSNKLLDIINKGK